MSVQTVANTIKHVLSQNLKLKIPNGLFVFNFSVETRSNIYKTEPEKYSK